MGVGVGFDTKGSFCGHKFFRPLETETEVYVIPDTREGWVDSLRILLESYLKPNRKTV